MNDLALSHEIRVYNDLKERLKQAFSLDEGDQTLLDSLEGETNLHEYLVTMLRKARERDAFASALGDMIKSMQARKSRLEEGSDKLRAAVAWALAETGQKRLEAPDFTASLSKGRAPLLVTDEKAAAQCFAKKREPELDRAALRESLENGTVLSFASLGNPGMHLIVRTK
jgi:hypothetical protein